jgi:hypothetical protein
MYFWEMLRTRDRRTYWVREPLSYETADEALDMTQYLNRCTSLICKGHRLVKIEHGMEVPIYYTLNSKIPVRASHASR